jgi:hypothetical protein
MSGDLLQDFWLPDWLTVDGVLFNRGELMRSRPAWWWTPRSRDAWRGFRIRLIWLSDQVRYGYVDPKLCWAECRLYLTGDHLALGSARHITEVADQSALTARLLKLRGVTPSRAAA